MSKKVCVLGLGYVGLPTATLLAVNGHSVVGVDTDARVVKSLQKGEPYIQERNLKALLETALRSGNLRISSLPEEADAFIIAVPTPITPEKKADLCAVEAASESIVPYLGKGNLVVLESTVPPGTTKNIVLPILRRASTAGDGEVYLAHAPERVLPGNILWELVQNSRVIGGIDPTSAKVAQELYRSFVEGEIYLTDATTAETVKVMENAYRDVNIAFANEMSSMAEAIGIDIWQAIELANKHPRVNILSPGPGVGGHCIPVDPWFLAEVFPESASLITGARRVNDGMPHHVVSLVRRELDSISRPVVTLLGVSYKGNVDDVRNSPAFPILEEMLALGWQVTMYDPHVRAITKHQELLKDLEASVRGSHCIVVLADHREFLDIDAARVAPLMEERLVIDCRNLLDQDTWRRCGFRVVVLGNGSFA
ncbi:MAG: nucleotide sugar dehydrogenase [Chloroflexi bacterium]|nr:nucleotide sugar dehydrogenase [Chloroflexota bacterium]